MYEIMPADETEIRQRLAHFGEDSLEPAVGHLGFMSPSARNVGQHWSIVVSRTDVIPGYFPFAKLTEKSYVSKLTIRAMNWAQIRHFIHFREY